MWVLIGRVSITVWKTWKGSRHRTRHRIRHHTPSHTPSHAIAYAIAHAITCSMENSRFEKESYFHVLVFYWLFYKRNRKHFFQCSHNVIETVVKVWENSKLRGNTLPAGLCCHCNFSFSQTSTCVSKTVMVRHRKCFLNVFFRCALVPSQSLLARGNLISKVYGTSYHRACIDLSHKWPPI